MSTLAGTAKALSWLCCEPAHTLLYDVTDVPTGATSVTDDRNVRIDYMLYSESSMRLLGVAPLPTPGEPIPNARHPSDHFPVTARFELTAQWKKHENNARAWLHIVAENSASFRPLSPDELATAFLYFDKNGSGTISVSELETGILRLQRVMTPQLVSQIVRRCHNAHYRCQCELARSSNPDELRSKSLVFPAAAAAGSQQDLRRMSQANHEISFEDFVAAHMQGITCARSVFIRDILKAFQLFDIDDSKGLTREQLVKAVHLLSPMKLEDGRIAKIWEAMDADNDGLVTTSEFSEWLCDAQRRAVLAEAVEARDVRSRRASTVRHVRELAKATPL